MRRSRPDRACVWSAGAAGTPDSRAQRFEVLANGSFVIRRAQAQDGGRYLCTAENAHGADRALVQLSVAPQQPRAAAGHYQDVTVSLGDTIAMECLAKGTPAPHISWIFPDGRVWQAASPAQGRVALHENRTLSIRDASFADSGVYKCVASNAAGADSLAIRLHVAALPPVIQQDKLENISLPPGLSVHVHCSAKAAPRPSVRWVLADGTHVRPSQFVHGNLFVFPNGTLYIRSLAPEDSGRYECVAANLVGAARRTVQLSVQRAAAHARITASSPRRTDVRYGATLRLDCRASGDPGPRILWRLPSKRVIDALFRYVRPASPSPPPPAARRTTRRHRDRAQGARGLLPLCPGRRRMRTRDAGRGLGAWFFFTIKSHHCNLKPQEVSALSPAPPKERELDSFAFNDYI